MSPWGRPGFLSAVNIALSFKDPKAQTAEVSSVYSLSGPCGWDLLSGCVLWHHVQPRNVQRRLQAQDPGSEVYLPMVLSVAGTGQFHSKKTELLLALCLDLFKY